MARILIWEEDDDLRMALAATLADCDHEILAAASAGEFEQHLQSGRAALIVFGLEGTGESALAPLRRASTAADLRLLPMIVISPSSDPEDVAAAQSFGAVAVIPKPWREGEIEIAVDLALSSRRDPFDSKERSGLPARRPRLSGSRAVSSTSGV